MRAKTLLTVLFLVSLAVAAVVLLRAMPQFAGTAVAEAAKDEILVATTPLPGGTLLRPQDVVWHKAKGETLPGTIVRPDAVAREAKPELDEDARAAVYGAALRKPLAEGDPIRRGEFSKPGDRDFLDIVLSPGMRAASIPITVIGMNGPNARLLGPFPGDRVDLILTQTFKDNLPVPITRHSVGEAVVQNVRVLAMPLPDTKNNNNNNNEIKTALVVEVSPEQAEKITVAETLGRLAFTLRGASDLDGVVATTTLATSTPGIVKANGIKPVWAGDVSPALGGAMPEKVVIIDAPPINVIRGSKGETVNQPWHADNGGAGATTANSGSSRE